VGLGLSYPLRPQYGVKPGQTPHGPRHARGRPGPGSRKIPRPFSTDFGTPSVQRLLRIRPTRVGFPFPLAECSAKRESDFGIPSISIIPVLQAAMSIALRRNRDRRVIGDNPPDCWQTMLRKIPAACSLCWCTSWLNIRVIHRSPSDSGTPPVPPLQSSTSPSRTLVPRFSDAGTPSPCYPPDFGTPL
jgi:hypothetical protein